MGGGWCLDLARLCFPSPKHPPPARVRRLPVEKAAGVSGLTLNLRGMDGPRAEDPRPPGLREAATPLPEPPTIPRSLRVTDIAGARPKQRVGRLLVV